MGPEEIKKVIERICQELRVQQIETADQHELTKDGCHGSTAKAELCVASDAWEVPGVVPLDDCKPHVLLDTFLRRCQNGTATKFARHLFQVVNDMEEAARSMQNFSVSIKI
jgi:hypothetical protein